MLLLLLLMLPSLPPLLLLLLPPLPLLLLLLPPLPMLLLPCLTCASSQGRLRGKIGLFPSNFVAVTSNAALPGDVLTDVEVRGGRVGEGCGGIASVTIRRMKVLQLWGFFVCL